MLEIFNYILLIVNSTINLRLNKQQLNVKKYIYMIYCTILLTKTIPFLLNSFING